MSAGWISVVAGLPFDGDAMMVSSVGELTRPRGAALPAVFLGGEFVEFESARRGERIEIPRVIAWQPFPPLRG